MEQLEPDWIGCSQSGIANTKSADPGSQAQINAGKAVGMAQRRHRKPLPGGWIQADRTAVALGRFNPAHNLAVGDGCIVRWQRVTPGYEDFVRNLNYSVRREAAVAPEKDDLAGLELSRIAPLHGYEIAGPKHRNHAGPGDFQLHFSVTARDLSDEIAAR
jgi:hypothetical protein